MAGLQAPELIIILVIILIIFGGAKLPKLAKSLGEARREFEKGTEEEEAEARRRKGAKAALADPAPVVDPVAGRSEADLAKEAELLQREADLLRREAELKRLDGESR